MVDVAQLVRAPDCGSGCRGFEPHLPPQKAFFRGLFLLLIFYGSAYSIIDMQSYCFVVSMKSILPRS